MIKAEQGNVNVDTSFLWERLNFYSEQNQNLSIFNPSLSPN